MATPAPVTRSEKGTASARRPATTLQRAVLGHYAILSVVTAWWFGGQSPGARDWLFAWGTLGILLFLLALGSLASLQPGLSRRALRQLWPLLLFDLLALVSCANPILRPVLREGVPYLMLVEAPHPWLPVCARPSEVIRQLWLLNGIILSSYNLYLVVRSRSQLRGLLLLLVGNAIALAVFGTFQRLVGAAGLYFGAVTSPQTYFFSTFVYHNHWGAFVLLHLAACLGLVFHSVRRGGYRDFWHSPALGGAVAALLLAAAIPLSASRSSSVLMVALAGGAVVHALVRVIRSRREHHESILLPVLGILACAIAGAAATAYLGRDVIRQRADLTLQQIAHIRHEDTLNSRLVLYRDTLRQISERPLVGWGLASYGDIFRIYNTQRAIEARFGQPYYKNAHNDWLQYLAEVGIVGVLLLVLLATLPFLAPGRLRFTESLLGSYLLAGCLLILVYALLEFPLANPSVLIGFWGLLFLNARYLAPDTAETAILPSLHV